MDLFDHYDTVILHQTFEVEAKLSEVLIYSVLILNQEVKTLLTHRDYFDSKSKKVFISFI